MKKLSILLFVLFTTLCFSQNEAKGREFIDALLVKKNYDLAHSYFDASVSGQIPKEQLGQVIQQVGGQLGRFKSIISVINQKDASVFYSEFENMKIDIQLAFTPRHTIVGFFFVPHKEAKAETKADDFIIKSGNVDLKGTLLVPKENNRKKLVVFLHGSGPQDRDETIADNKPFKDIAEGLLAQGIASYRFDKRTLSNPESFSGQSTIDDEYTVDALTIINYFKSHELYNDYEIVLLGHSLGGYILPRISNKDNRVSKLVFLAASARGLDELIVEQYEYLYTLNPSEEFKKEVAKVKEQAALLHSKSFTPDTPADKLPLGVSYAYWKSLLDYKPLEEAKKINVLTLVLQGERDYQVTMKDFNLLKKAIKSKGSKFISYPTLNHLFMEGTGKATPAEYSVKGNVSPKVIKDIADFILGSK